MDRAYLALAHYRANNPASRAVYPYTVAGSGANVRRAHCVLCRTLIATCSAKWPETKTYQTAIAEHTGRASIATSRRSSRARRPGVRGLP